MKISELKKNLDNCIDCALCYDVCPMLSAFGDKTKNILDNMYLNKINSYDIAYSCMLCNSCVEKCPKNIDLKGMFQNLRIKLYKENLREANKSFKLRIVRNHQRASFSNFLASKNNNRKVDRIFIPGCSLSGYDNNIILKIRDYLVDNLKEVEVILKCCGKPSKDIGNLDGFKSNMNKIKQFLHEKEVKEVIVACENCYKTFKEELKEIKVITLWETIDNFKIPKELKSKYLNLQDEFALHDPCPIKDEEKIHDSVRNILKDLGIKTLEFEKNRNETECCGCGGMVGVTNKTLFTKQRDKRANSTNCKNIISYCESCVSAFKYSNKNSLHLLDFIFNDEVISGEIKSQKSINSLNQWINRIKLVKKLEK